MKCTPPHAPCPPLVYSCVSMHDPKKASLTWGIHSEWECDRPDEKLWDTCRSRAVLLRSDRQRTSPH